MLLVVTDLFRVTYTFFFYNFIYLFIFGCSVPSLPAGFSVVAGIGGCSLVGVLGLLILLLQSVGSRRVGFSSFGGTGLVAPCGILWDLPGPGIVPGSCALVGGFLTTGGGGGLIAKSLITREAPRSHILNICLNFIHVYFVSWYQATREMINWPV